MRGPSASILIDGGLPWRNVYLQGRAVTFALHHPKIPGARVVRALPHVRVLRSVPVR